LCSVATQEVASRASGIGTAQRSGCKKLRLSL
jgi:hypothetical protein